MAWRQTAEEGPAAQQAGSRLAREATASLAGLLAERGMTRKDLAECMGVSPGRVSQILSGGENLTLRSLAAVAESLGATVEIVFRDRPDDDRDFCAAEPTRATAAKARPFARSRHF
ncbi:transcriptional regulator with XRE-family HTH domain [Streptomyces olivoverticillatus]|uniref:Transcriptional regulator with XRE-family HTH domain n=1 Tax=Streptomyces olivoverticillatus TaxID=66427 RepID=A0A7W7LP10_9ACTN|nr:helix-turn-helix transcriptional regulator [Streptomyces olivoverticillatus]MBB4893141.1 transcriptional regulator with XRE-family HTH domain [Streptomyces olivoverticillatus]